MAHLSENSQRLKINLVVVSNEQELRRQTRGYNDVLLLRLPACRPGQYDQRLQAVGPPLAKAAADLGPEAVLIVVGEAVDLVAVQTELASVTRYQSWIAVKRLTSQTNGAAALPSHHFGALILTRYQASLRHTKTRIAYSWCPACDKTSKDYGGKKHTYHEYGTLMSDVWRDLACDLSGDLTPLVERFADFFGLEPHRELRVADCSSWLNTRTEAPKVLQQDATPPLFSPPLNTLLQGDCLEHLRQLPSNSIDFAFADPPYNVGKNYTGYSDDLTITEYFEWCDEWLGELARVLKPGRTVAVLNIPLWSIRHFLYLQTKLNFQNWIAWDALSYPVRLLMPAHYAILCFTKGESRPLPGLQEPPRVNPSLAQLRNGEFLAPLDEGYCLRQQCVSSRRAGNWNDRGILTDLWWDVHRLKHNTRRVDHPCQVPAQLMYRLLSLFTQPRETVLDCFNGAGTTTLAAHQLDRHYIGIERETAYHELALSRHEEIAAGLDPFRKAERALTAKNSSVPRLTKQKYAVPKKTLQLEVKRIAQELGHLPTRDEVIHYGRHPIAYYDQYFISWGEVCAAARNTGMSETRLNDELGKQPNLFE
ncbi:MAG TPA: DNA methyltransferase [Blastocatellia bacterium]|nr:DNA methyltransferase [Blastocatellia bacterium]HMX25510.1 DNA methyltransferase [Blastocatellia bacterium]HMZ22207.1 DNA methyltransferase [Blastocatellia bacterium]HNG33316.1 DNA methyltransferase [Blastocatellia bacterium]